MSDRTVNCKKLGKELPGLAEAPVEGELGQEILDNGSQEAWTLWNDDMMSKVINEYRLNVADQEHHDVLIKQMRAFLGLDEGGEGLLQVENPERGQ